MDVIATFKSPFLVDGSIPIVPFTHLVASCNQRTTSEHILCRQASIFQDWSNGCMDMTVLLVTMNDKRDYILLTDTFCEGLVIVESEQLYLKHPFDVSVAPSFQHLLQQTGRDLNTLHVRRKHHIHCRNTRISIRWLPRVLCLGPLKRWHC